MDGHEFFSSRRRCCDQCSQRTVTVNGEPVIEYYHRGVVCHLIGFDLALPLDVEMQRPGEGNELMPRLAKIVTFFQCYALVAGARKASLVPPYVRWA